MELLDTSDTNSLSYWLNWRFLLCALWVVMPMIVAAFIIFKYEYFDSLESDSERVQVNAKFWYADEAWRPCVKEISPNWLMAFRIFAFCLILTALIIDFVVQGGSMINYYTQWTFILVTIYFGFGSGLSMYGCFQHHKTYNRFNVCHDENDAERGSYISLVHGETVNSVTREKDPDYHQKYYVFRTAMNWSHAFQILFQMTAGAVILTDSVYWCIIFPFLTARDKRLNMLTVIEHSLNAILLFGDTALNGLRFPWFRISYFILLTGVYVIFEWIVHASVSLWWPYPILDLSSSYAPLWYLCVALLHLPCYALFALIVKTKHSVLSKRFPQSYQILR